jgi:hypothetical protein
MFFLIGEHMPFLAKRKLGGKDVEDERAAH